MPKLTIDNRTVTVPEGTNVLEAAKQLGIVIPHFCYHEALGAVGACRLCAMKFEEGPVQGVKMACMVPAQDGMVISTTDAVASELRASVIEWLMLSHPHDCPVCDEGGECLLQDMTIAGGHGLRRYRGKKRTFPNQDLGPFIEQEMNRCITCYRCARTYRDYCGGQDFGVFGSRNRVFFGRFREGRLESPFSGNLADVCPTGVFTDKTFRFKSRIWDLQEAPSICPHCSLGCSSIPGGRYRELQRVRGGKNPATNDFFICDRGRFGYGHANHPDRPRTPRVAAAETGMTEAIRTARERLDDLAGRYGPDSIAFLGSPRASFEANVLLARWAQQVGSRYLLFDANRERDLAARITAARLGQHRRGLADVRQSDLLLLVGADPLNEAPMLGLAIRQAVRNGARVVVVDPRPVELPCQYEHLPLAPQPLDAFLAGLAGDEATALDSDQSDRLDGLKSALQEAERPLLIGGSDLLGAAGIDRLFDAAQQFGSRTGVMVLLAGPNSFGGGLLAGQAPDFDRLADAMQAGEVKALVCLQADPFREAVNPARAQAALGRLELLVAIDGTPSLAAQRAEIFLPARVTAEMAGSYLNHQGRLQAFLPVIEPGVPIRVTGGGDHPPREFRPDTPGALPLPDWMILAEVLALGSDLDSVRRTIAAADQRFSGLPDLLAETEGLSVPLDDLARFPLSDQTAEVTETGQLPLLPTTAFIGSDWLAHLSAPLEPLRPEPTVWLHPDQAAALQLEDGDRASLTTHLGHCRVTVRFAPRMAPGLALTHQLQGSALEGLTPGRVLGCNLDKSEGGA